MPKKSKSKSRVTPIQQSLEGSEDFSLEQQEAKHESKSAKSTKVVRTTGKRTKTSDEPEVMSYRHKDKRVNNPDVGLVTPESDEVAEPKEWKYDPHIDPALQFDMQRGQIEDLIDNALASEDEEVMQAALEQLKRQAEPYLNWAGKAERTNFKVDTVSLHVHERIDPATILGSVRKRMKDDKAASKPRQGDWFKAWFEEPLPLREAIDFYKHERGWANRLIAGDSLLVMNSLLQKESMAGQVQMIYIDPPYGIRYGSNFQPFVNKRDVKDRKDEDLTQEPEMVKAFRDTWELGIHSYLTYLRDRLLLAKDLLSETGSIFVQISDENVHRIRNLCDEVLGNENFVSIVSYSVSSGMGANLLPRENDFLVWYAKDLKKIKYNQLFFSKHLDGDGADAYRLVELQNGSIRRLAENDYDEKGELREGGRVLRFGDATKPGPGQKYEIEAFGRAFDSGSRWWGLPPEALHRAIKANRIVPSGNSLVLKRYLDDWPAFPITNVWKDTGTGAALGKVYAVQTNDKVIERCVLMTTEPGDLVFDPTCGSGTTAFVSEKWGRRWITCDTSRVATALAKQRLLTASYDYFELKYPYEGLKAGFLYQSVPHVTLESVANNLEIDEIYESFHPEILKSLSDLNSALRSCRAPHLFEVSNGARKGRALNFLKGDVLSEWEVPFDFPTDWPDSVRVMFDRYHAARQSMQQRMERSIAEHAHQEILFDQPHISRDKLRITGPFTVEAVPFPSVLSLEEAEQPKDADVAIARSGESARQHTWRDELLKTGIRGKNGQMLRFASLETLPSLHYIHADGRLSDTGERVVVSFGPEYAALEQRQVEMAMREAGDLFPRPKIIVFCAFTFDPEAAKDIDETKGITALKVQMNTDLLTEDLKKARVSNQSFWLMGQPDVEVHKAKDGRYQVEVNGFDYFDTVKGDLIGGGKGKIAMWLLDTDYDDRSLFPRQVFFPMAGKREGWEKLKKNIRAELDESLLKHLHSTVSLPFERSENGRIAVKIIDDRGIESLKIIQLD